MTKPTSPKFHHPKTIKRSEFTEILNYTLKLKDFLGIAAAFLPWCFIPSVFMLYSLLSTLGLSFLFQSSIETSSELISLVLFAGTILLIGTVLISIPPYLIASYMEMDNIPNSKYKKKFYALTWGGLIFSNFIIILIEGAYYFTVWLYFLTLALTSITFIWLTLPATQLKAKLTIRAGRYKTFAEIVIRLMMIGFSQLLYTIPLACVYLLIKNEGEIIHSEFNWLSIVIFSFYIVTSVVYLQSYWRKILKKEKSLIKFHIKSTAGFSLIVLYFIAICSNTFLFAIAISAGITDKQNQSQWYGIKDESLKMHNPKILTWRKDSIKEGKYLYGFIAFRFAENRVLCPIETPLDSKVVYNCLILEKSDIKPLGKVPGWESPKIKSISKKIG